MYFYVFKAITEESVLFLGTRHGQALYEGLLGEGVQDNQGYAADKHADTDQLHLASQRDRDVFGRVPGEVLAHDGGDIAQFPGINLVSGDEVPRIEQVGPLPDETEEEAD